MRAALLTRSAHPLHPPGGLERAVYWQAKHLSARGIEPVLYTRPASERGEFPGEVVTVSYRSLPGLRHGRVLDRTLNYPAFAMALGQAVARDVRAGRIDVVDAQGVAGLGYARLRAADPSLRAPLVVNPQGMEEHKTSGLKRLALCRLRALSRATARAADAVIATDEATRDEVPRLLGVDRARVTVVPNGLDLAEIAAATPADPSRLVHEALPGLAGAFPVLLSVGRLELYKGFADVRDALRGLSGRLPARWAWIVVGEGPARKELSGDHVHLAGRVGESLLHALYERADVFVHATRFEGSSLVTLEAMAHGLPVIATRAGGIPDKVEDGVSGRLLEPGDVAGLGQAIEQAAGDAALRARWGQAGRRQVEARFSWTTIVDRLIALYERLLRERR